MRGAKFCEIDDGWHSVSTWIRRRFGPAEIREYFPEGLEHGEVLRRRWMIEEIADEMIAAAREPFPPGLLLAMRKSAAARRRGVPVEKLFPPDLDPAEVLLELDAGDLRVRCDLVAALFGAPRRGNRVAPQA
jgi:hypothetical protein